MKILLVTRGHFLKYPQRYFEPQYRGIDIDPGIAGGFGWYWAKALKELGHEVRPFIYYKSPSLDSCGQINMRIHRCMHRFPLFRLLPASLMNRRLIKVSLDYKPALILIDAGESIDPETLREIKKSTGARLVNWLLDDPVMQGWKNVVKSLPVYDHVFTFDALHIPRLKEWGASSVEHLSCACDPDIHRSLFLSEDDKRTLGHDLCFVGAITDRRIAVLKQLRGFDLGIWTWNPGRLKVDPFLAGCYRGRASGTPMNRIFNASKIVINIHHPQSASGLNMKGFEIAASGSFQLVDERPGLDDIFQKDKEIVCYESFDQLKELIARFLDQPEKRREMGKAAQQAVYQSHTYKHRLNRLISTVTQSM